MKYALKTKPAIINFSPLGFRLAAQDFLDCYKAYKPNTGRYSIVPFFLCCRAIELSLKAIHLRKKRQKEVKYEFGHYLKASYNALLRTHQTLSRPEVELLQKADILYNEKVFEYIQPHDAATAFSRFPDLKAPGALAKIILDLAIKHVPDHA
jgi:hypothetical protein